MYSALNVDLRPGHGFGIFELGTSLWTLLDTLRRHPHVYPQIDIKYDVDTSATTPIIVHIRPHLDLLFSGKQQRLHTVCIRKLRDPNPPVTVHYNDTILSSSASSASGEEVLRRVGVDRVFGPTYPGEELRYPGIWFSFDEDRIGEGVDASVKLPRAQGGDRLQEVKRIIISQIDEEGKGKTGDALDEVAECAVMAGELARAVVKVHDGVTLYFHPTASSTSLHVRIGETTAQDLTLDLGPPLRVHYKEDERMKIHALTKSSSSSSSKPDDGTGYFYNYFQYGIDFLISETTHVVSKIILHSNVPGSPLFQRYKRCNWEIEGKPEDDEDDTPPRKRFFDRFETISHFLSPREPPPSMSLDRTAEDEQLNLPNSTTHLHGYDGIILEATDSSQVVSVMLF